MENNQRYTRIAQKLSQTFICSGTHATLPSINISIVTVLLNSDLECYTIVKLPYPYPSCSIGP